MPTPHDTFREQLLDLSYGELDRRAEKALRAHLETCAACRAELAQLAGTREAMAALGQEPAPERGEAILLAAAREAARQRQRKPFLPAWLWGTSLSAVAAVAVALVSYKLAGQGPNAFQRHPADELVPYSAPAEVAQAPLAAPPEAAQPEAAPEAEGRLAGEARRADGEGDSAEAGAAGPAPKPSLAAAPRKERARGASEKKQAADLARPAPARAPAAAPVQAPVEDLGSAEEEQLAADAAPDHSGAGTGGRMVAQGAPSDASTQAAEAPASAPPPPVAPEAARREQPGAAVASLAEKGDRSAARAKGAASKAATAVEREDPISRHQRLRVAGRLHGASAAYPGCAAETSREVDLDGQGRVVRYTRRGTAAGAPFQAELFYGEDGSLGAVRFQAKGRVHEVRIGPDGALPGGSGVPAFALEPRQASQAGPDAPPRCGG